MKISLFTLLPIIIFIAPVIYKVFYQMFYTKDGDEIQIGETEITEIEGGADIKSVSHKKFKQEKENFPDNLVDHISDGDTNAVSSENPNGVTHWWFFTKK